MSCLTVASAVYAWSSDGGRAREGDPEVPVGCRMVTGDGVWFGGETVGIVLHGRQTSVYRQWVSTTGAALESDDDGAMAEARI
jgi:hypothetical protein